MRKVMHHDSANVCNDSNDGDGIIATGRMSQQSSILNTRHPSAGIHSDPSTSLPSHDEESIPTSSSRRGTKAASSLPPRPLHLASQSQAVPAGSRAPASPPTGSLSPRQPSPFLHFPGLNGPKFVALRRELFHNSSVQQRQRILSLSATQLHLDYPQVARKIASLNPNKDKVPFRQFWKLLNSAWKQQILDSPTATHSTSSTTTILPSLQTLNSSSSSTSSSSTFHLSPHSRTPCPALACESARSSPSHGTVLGHKTIHGSSSSNKRTNKKRSHVNCTTKTAARASKTAKIVPSHMARLFRSTSTSSTTGADTDTGTDTRTTIHHYSSQQHCTTPNIQHNIPLSRSSHVAENHHQQSAHTFTQATGESTESQNSSLQQAEKAIQQPPSKASDHAFTHVHRCTKSNDGHLAKNCLQTLPVEAEKSPFHTLPVEAEVSSSHTLPVEAEVSPFHTSPVEAEKSPSHTLPVEAEVSSSHTSPVEVEKSPSHTLPVEAEVSHAHTLPVEAEKSPPISSNDATIRSLKQLLQEMPSDAPRARVLNMTAVQICQVFARSLGRNYSQNKRFELFWNQLREQWQEELLCQKSRAMPGRRDPHAHTSQTTTGDHNSKRKQTNVDRDIVGKGEGELLCPFSDVVPSSSRDCHIKQQVKPMENLCTVDGCGSKSNPICVDMDTCDIAQMGGGEDAALLEPEAIVPTSKARDINCDEPRTHNKCRVVGILRLKENSVNESGPSRSTAHSVPPSQEKAYTSNSRRDQVQRLLELNRLLQSTNFEDELMPLLVERFEACSTAQKKEWIDELQARMYSVQ